MGTQTKIAAKERPILFSAPMVLALLAGTKTQTRRALKSQPLEIIKGKKINGVQSWIGLTERGEKIEDNRGVCFRCKFGESGDRLWVRESWKPYATECGERGAVYAADKTRKAAGHDWRHPVPIARQSADAWRPSIFMPRWASRLTLEVTEVRVQRLQSISVDDCRAEGFDGSSNSVKSPYSEFAAIWDAINGEKSWDGNPWVWAISFRKVDQPAKGI